MGCMGYLSSGGSNDFQYWILFSILNMRDFQEIQLVSQTDLGTIYKYAVKFLCNNQVPFQFSHTCSVSLYSSVNL